MIYSMLTNAQLCRAITTVKNYIVLDTRYSCNHSVGKVTFTDVLPNLESDEILVADMCDVTGLQYEVQNMVDRVSRALTRDCYYDTLENNLKSYGLTPYQYQKAIKWLAA